MKLLGGDWSRGDFIALTGLVVAVVTTALTVPEFRSYLGLRSDTQPAPSAQAKPVPSPNQTDVSSHAVDTNAASSPRIWECIRAKYRPENLYPEETQPTQDSLDGSLLDLVAAGNLKCVQRLLDAKANINAYRSSPHPSFLDGPPLHLALDQRQWTVALFLLSKGADPNLPTSYVDDSTGVPYGALDVAYASGAPPNVISDLKEKGAKRLKFK